MWLAINHYYTSFSRICIVMHRGSEMGEGRGAHRLISRTILGTTHIRLLKHNLSLPIVSKDGSSSHACHYQMATKVDVNPIARIQDYSRKLCDKGPCKNNVIT